MYIYYIFTFQNFIIYHTFLYPISQDIWYHPQDAAKGYLNSKLNTLRRALPDQKKMKPRKKKLRGSDERPTYIVMEEDEREQNRLLANRTTNNDDMLELMSISFTSRRKWIQLTVPTAGELLKQYPRLVTSDACVSIHLYCLKYM